MEYLVTQVEQNEIRSAIELFESKSDAEIVTVIAKQSDEYLYIPTLWAGVIAFALPYIYLFFGSLTQKEIALVQLFSFFILAIITRLKPIKMLLVPASIKRKRSANRANAKFVELLGQNSQQNGLVMLYVSEAEKYVQILTDATILQKVDNALWSEMVESFIAHVKEGRIAQGYLETIAKTSELLIELFPKTKEDKDTLPNHLILI
ncbi:TPM domain-containing protein [Sulfurimonas sp.]|uniref:TPM domain-containing protein n=1 Tax=Sulfurimonas sp. TaxID=2022749 RepID=UPI003D0B50D7